MESDSTEYFADESRIKILFSTPINFVACAHKLEVCGIDFLVCFMLRGLEWHMRN
jgi:hypothetical protein